MRDYQPDEFEVIVSRVHEQDVILVHGRGSLDVICSIVQDSQKAAGAHANIFGAFKVGACCRFAVYSMTGQCWGVHGSFFIDLAFPLLFTMSCRESVNVCASHGS